MTVLDKFRFSIDTNMNTYLPKVTLGIISWNRLHYLRATLESARQCILYPNLEWIVIDNESNEPGLKEYLDGQTWIDQKIYKKQTHADAMNQLIQQSNGEMVLIWPEDMQFTVAGDWMIDIVEFLSQNLWLGTICLNYLRKETNRTLFTWRAWLEWRKTKSEFKRVGSNFRLRKKLYSSRGTGLHTLGWLWPGMVGSGIPSIARTETWKRIGPWKTRATSSQRLVDSSLGAEEDMNSRFEQSKEILQQAILTTPVAADIVTDSTGCKAKVRGNKRYGAYFPPPQGDFYYQISPWEQFLTLQKSEIPLSFEDYVTPLGFTLPFDANGNLLKSGINTSIETDI